MSDNPRIRISTGGRTVTTTLERMQQLSRSLTRPTGEEIAALAPDDLYPVPSGARFRDAGEFLEAPDLEAMADVLIENWRELSHLAAVRIRYLWRAKGTGSAQARTTKASGFWRMLTGLDVVVWLGAGPLRAQFYTREQVEGTLYHELRHIDWDEEKGQPFLVEHDAEVFFDEFRRYGIRRPDHARFGQLALDGAFARGEGLKPPRFGYCQSCGELIRLADGCATCRPLDEQPAEKPEACRSCGQVVDPADAGALPFLRDGLCFECRESGGAE